MAQLFTGATEEYDGSTWTSVNSLNTARAYLAGCGIQTAALAFGGGTPPITGATELYDGTSWTSSPASMATARTDLAGAGTQALGLGFGGNPITAATEEWTGAGPQQLQSQLLNLYLFYLINVERVKK
jgi:hypothetical protein